jgi:hypothetical protein
MMASENAKKHIQPVKPPFVFVHSTLSKPGRVVIWILIIVIGISYYLSQFPVPEIVRDALDALSLNQFRSIEDEAKWILQKHPLIGEPLRVQFPSSSLMCDRWPQ